MVTAPKILSLSPKEEVEIRRKAGEFDHLNTRKKRLIMRRCEVEIGQRRDVVRKEWREVKIKAKEKAKLGAVDLSITGNVESVGGVNVDV